MKKKIKGLKREIRPASMTGRVDKSFSSDEGIVVIIERENGEDEIFMYFNSLIILPITKG